MQRYLVDTFWLLQIDRLKRVKDIGESYQRPTLFAFEGYGRDANSLQPLHQTTTGRIAGLCVARER